MRQPKKFKQITKFHLFIVAGIIWIIVLAIFMILQSVPPIIDENQTLKTLSLIEHNVLNSEPITPLPEPKNLNLAKVTLGFKLFSDSNLSSSSEKPRRSGRGCKRLNFKFFIVCKIYPVLKSTQNVTSS